MLEVLIVPACFLGAGLLGHRLGTPPRVAVGLAAVGACHLLAFLGAHQALAATGTSAALIHLVSQWLFLGGFVALVWLAAAYPTARPSAVLVGSACVIALTGPAVAALAGPTPALVDDTRRLGPVVQLLPDSFGGLASAALPVLPLMAMVTFAVRYRRTSAEDRAPMRWPIAGVALIAALALAGTTLAADHQWMVTALFLIGAPVFPLSLAFGPVIRRLDSLTADVTELSRRLQLRPAPPPGVLARLTPRELTVLEAMAAGMANPVIARSIHLSLSSVEKHVTSIFRKLEIPDGADVHRRVSAVVAYRDALEHGPHTSAE